MRCPKCSAENHDLAQVCLYCDSPLSYIPEVREEPDVRTSRLAAASAILAVLSIPGFIMYSGAATYRSMQVYPYSSGASIPMFAYASYFSAISAVLLGLAALACIEIKYGRLTGRGLAVIGIAIPLIGSCVTGARMSMANMRGTAYRMACTTNLSGLGKAMLIYANDYDDEMPRAGGRNSTLGSTPDWLANTAAEAYGLEDGPGRASMSANFYLLVKYAEVTPKSFQCDRDLGFKEFDPGDYNLGNRDIVSLWDFGPDPAKHVSFSYHVPYGSYGLSFASVPSMAIAADRNPWLPNSGIWRPKKDFQAFDPNGTSRIIRRGNSLTHDAEGQNVLFIDGHTSFERQSFCGDKNDNIYTTQNGTDVKKGFLPTMTSQPVNKRDSLLLQDPPKGKAK